MIPYSERYKIGNLGRMIGICIVSVIVVGMILIVFRKWK
jgi:hypothetical protein